MSMFGYFTERHICPHEFTSILRRFNTGQFNNSMRQRRTIGYTMSSTEKF